MQLTISIAGMQLAILHTKFSIAGYWNIDTIGPNMWDIVYKVPDLSQSTISIARILTNYVAPESITQDMYVTSAQIVSGVKV